MGREARVEGRLGDTSGEVKLHLDSEQLTVSGAFRLKLPLASLTKVEVAGEWLVLERPEERLEFCLGAAPAARWAAAIEDPPSLARKLGLKADTRLALLGELPPEVLQAVAESGAPVVYGGPLAKAPRLAADLLLFAMTPGAFAEDFARIAPRLGEAKAAWALFRKAVKGAGETEVILAGRAAGLKDTKVAKVTDSHTALRFIGPRP